MAAGDNTSGCGAAGEGSYTPALIGSTCFNPSMATDKMKALCVIGVLVPCSQLKTHQLLSIRMSNVK